MASMTTARYSTSEANTTSSVRYLLVGVVAAIIGLLPWLITGMRLPLQNLWEVNTLPADMPIVLLPFSQYTVMLLASVMIVGSAIAGGVARRLRNRISRRDLATIVAGVVGFQAVATLQTAVVVGSGLRESAASGLYIAALVTGSIVAILVGFLVLVLIARGRAPAVVIALSIAAIAVGQWVNRLVLPKFSAATDVQIDLLGTLYWLPAIVVGLAVVWSGVATIGRVVAAAVTLVLLWVAPALITGVSAATGTRLLLPRPAEMAEYGVGVFLLALGPAGGAPRLVLAAILVMVVGLVARWGFRRWKVRSRLSESN